MHYVIHGPGCCNNSYLLNLSMNFVPPAGIEPAISRLKAGSFTTQLQGELPPALRGCLLTFMFKHLCHTILPRPVHSVIQRPLFLRFFSSSSKTSRTTFSISSFVYFFPSYFIVEVKGLEPPTLCLQSRCSSQLSYTPKIKNPPVVCGRISHLTTLSVLT